MEAMTQIQSTKTAASEPTSSAKQTKTMSKTDFLSLLQNMFPGKSDKVDSLLASFETQNAAERGTQSEDGETPADLRSIVHLLYGSLMQQGDDLAQWMIPQEGIPAEDENSEKSDTSNQSDIAITSIESAISTTIQPLFFNIQNASEEQPVGISNANARSTDISRPSESLNHSNSGAYVSISSSTTTIDSQYFMMQTPDNIGAASTDDSQKAVLSTVNPEALSQTTAPSNASTSISADIGTIIPAADNNRLFYDRNRSARTDRMQNLQTIDTKGNETNGTQWSAGSDPLSAMRQKMLYENSISEAKKLLSGGNRTAAIQLNSAQTDNKSTEMDATESDPTESNVRGKDGTVTLFDNAVKMVEPPKSEGIVTIQTEKDQTLIADKESVLSQVKTGVVAKLSDDNNEFVIRLKPEGLGEITVVMTKTSDKIILNIIASSAQTEKLLSSEISNLRDSLRIYNAELQQVTSAETGQLMSESYSQSYRDGHLDQWNNPQEQRHSYNAYGSGVANSEQTDVPKDRILYVGSSLLNKYI